MPGFDDFLLRALLGGLGVALLAGPLGCLVVWRRMAYFGNALAHSALLGVALALFLSLPPTAGIAAVCIAVALLFLLLQRQRLLAGDTLLGILAHGTLAFGLIALAFMEEMRVDLMGYLFGDILAVSGGDLAVIYGLLLISTAALLVYWRPLLSATVHEDMAAVEGVPVRRMQLLFTVLLALVIAVGMKIVGILLIVSLLIVPAATARRLSVTPEQMAVLAALFGGLAVLAGLGASMHWDIPTGPAIAAASVLGFALLLPRWWRGRGRQGGAAVAAREQAEREAGT